MTDTLLLVIEYNNPVVRMQRCCICHHDCQQNLSESQNKNIWVWFEILRREWTILLQTRASKLIQLYRKKVTSANVREAPIWWTNPNIRKWSWRKESSESELEFWRKKMWRIYWIHKKIQKKWFKTYPFSKRDLMTHIKFRLLLCEEMNEQFERIFIEHWDKHPFNYGALVFKASHHGSPHFTKEFLQKVKPSCRKIQN